MTAPHVQTIARVLRSRILDCEELPPTDSPDFTVLRQAIRTLQDRGTASEYVQLADSVLGDLIGLSTGKLRAEAAMIQVQIGILRGGE